MTPTEKAEAALNSRIERFQINLGAAQSDAERQLQFQALIVCVGIGEALRDYIKTIGEFARGLHGELKEAHDSLTVRHEQVLKHGHELLEQWKANPKDQALLKEIEQVKRDMTMIQKTLRRGADSLRRDTGPSMAMIDPLAATIRRFGEADELDGLRRLVGVFLEHAHELYRTQPTLPAKNLIDPEAWESSALAEVDQATDFHEAYARAGFQAIVAIEVMILAVSATPPNDAEDATSRANRAASDRLKQIATRLTDG